MKTTIGFVGLGRIGKPIAANILAAGFDLMVFDVRDEPVGELARLGAKRARRLRDLSEHAEIVGVAVVDDSQVEEVLMSNAGLLQSGRRDSIIMIHSTIMPGTVRKLAQLGQARGVTVVDAPVSGGEEGARQRQLCYMVGGDKEVFERVRPVLAASASHIFHVGELGSGAAAKMILQVVVCINMLGASEAELLADKCGLDFQSAARSSSRQFRPKFRRRSLAREIQTAAGSAVNSAAARRGFCGKSCTRAALGKGLGHCPPRRDPGSGTFPTHHGLG